MKITFYGGVKSVTGANYLLEHGSVKILVDCGLFQGSRYADDLNYEKFPYNPAEIDFVFITHSHTDHIGRIPKLQKDGFKGNIYATRPTLELAQLSLEDNLDLLRDEAKEMGHEPLFAAKDVEEVFARSIPLEYEEILDLGEGIQARLHDAAHILGSSIIEISWSDDKGERKFIYFTGDLGNSPNPLLKSHYEPENADYAVIESAYGSRLHENAASRKDILEDVIEEIVGKGGTIIIPSFAIERTQELLYEIHELLSNRRIPQIPVYLDSPLAIRLTDVYLHSKSYFNESAEMDLKKWGGLFNFTMLHKTITTDQSKKINEVRQSKIIIAGSGMSNGGRILHHEMRYLPDPNSAIVFVGYQVKGSLGRRILDGEKDVTILGQKTQVYCKVVAIGGYSAHADQAGLVSWLKKADAQEKLKKVFVVQGEEESSTALAIKARDSLALDAVVPDVGQSFEL